MIETDSDKMGTKWSPQWQMVKAMHEPELTGKQNTTPAGSWASVLPRKMHSGDAFGIQLQF